MVLYFCKQAQLPPSDEQLARELAAFCSQVTKFSPITLQVGRSTGGKI